MCGIIGVAASAPVASRDWVAAGRDAMRHRGPDDKGLYWSDDKRVGLGHRRLSVVDLSLLGHQPMRSDQGDLWITYNGEIYNHLMLREKLEGLGHCFRSSSDTEVVLAAYRQWGRDFLSRIDGMFALALHDVQKGTVLIARDRAGEKPLFYRLKGRELRFSSELKGLFADPGFEKVVDAEALDCYLAMGYVPAPRTILAGVAKLPPAHALEFDCRTGDTDSWAYWSIPRLRPGADAADGEELVRRLETILEGAVRRQLIADVPVGLLLSGGVDSSLITALAARGGGRLKTYTVGFPQFADYDESAHAALIASHFGTDHMVLETDQVGPEILTRLASQYDEPMIDSSMIPSFLVSEQIRDHCKVALGGDGGDELFGGYYSASRAALLQGILSGVPVWPRRLIAYAATRFLPSGMTRRALRMLGTDIDHGLPPVAVQIDEIARPRLLGQADWATTAERVRAGRIPDEADAVQRMTRFDFSNYMTEDILVKIDRASMLHSLEVRAPFLDREVIEFAFGEVPSRWKATPKERKIILRALTRRILPPEFNSMRKQGFTIPLVRWLRSGPWRAHFEDILFDPASIFAAKEVAAMFRDIDKGRTSPEPLFGLVMFELWRRHYGIQMPSEIERRAA